MQTCCICLENTSNKICSVCEIYAHSKCWKNYLNFSNALINYSGIWLTICPGCRSIGSAVQRITRQTTFIVRESNLIHKIKKLLIICEYESSNTKKIIVSYIFNLLIKNKIILFNNSFFTKVVQEKLKELYYKDNWSKAVYFYQKIFNTSIHIN